MILQALAFLLGDICLQQFSHLPSLIICLFISAIIIFFIKRNSWNAVIISFLFGFLWTLWFANILLNRSIPKELEGKTIVIEGVIASIPDVTSHQSTFLFKLSKINNQTTKGLIHLSWHAHFKKLNAGDYWRLSVRLKRIHGLSNPGGFDYEAWALQAGIAGSGYVLPKAENSLLQQTYFSINHFRQYLKEKMELTHISPWLTGLVIGERQGVTQDDWKVLRNTGTNHLMAIAGLHVGIMSGFMLLLVSYCWRRVPRLTYFLPAQHAGAISALIVAFVYSALAGFSIPTQRACIMLTCFLLALLLRRKITAWQSWAFALLLVLIQNPLSVLTESFWLSFGAVALIIYGVSSRLHPKGIWWRWGRIQWVLSIGLIPLCIGLFQECSLISFIANAIAIPWIGFIIVPLTLFGSLCLLISVKYGSLFLWLANKNLFLLWKILTYLSNVSWAVWYHAIPQHWVLIVACIGIIFLLLPIGFPGKWFGLVWLMPLIFFQPNLLKEGEAHFTLLDVGQGLSAVLQTQNHVMVFDAGARLNDNYDMGYNVVVPFLRSQGIKKIDMLVISHGDNDHLGGSSSILKEMEVTEIRTSVPDKIPNSTYCLQNQTWTWDKVNLKVLYPSEDDLDRGNDSSCVIKVTASGKSILLTGDIEKIAEKNLVENNRSDLSSDVLIAPHHGSKTSAQDEFIEAVNPRFVLFPVGYRNRYHFPNVSVVEKYHQRQTNMLDTVNSGAIQWLMTADKLNLVSYRMANLHYYAR